MLPTISTGNVASSLVGEYDVANSLRFNDGSSDNLVRTNASATNNTKYTLSAWVKRTTLGTNQSLLYNWYDGSSHAYIFFATDDKLALYDQLGGTDNINMKTTAVFRDVSAWYNIIVKVDTTESTQADRVRVFINGVEDSIGTRSSQPGSSASLGMKTNSLTNYMAISSFVNNSSTYLDVYIAEAVYIDGQALDPTSFGEFDEDSPTIWKPIDVSGLTFGTNGFYLDFEDSSALGNDAAGSNNFTVNNLTAIDQSTDTCTNNFATLNSLGSVQQGTLSEGNLKVTSSSAYKIAPSTIAVSSGKWYVEHKITGSSPDVMVGIISVDDYEANPGNINYAGDHANSVGYYKDGRRWIANGATSYGATYTTDDIIGIALDLDSGTKTITFYKNGASQGSINLPSNDDLDYYFLPSPYNGTIEINFGSPSYSISSGNSDANGYGNFEYGVPSGFYSLNTKNLSEFG